MTKLIRALFRRFTHRNRFGESVKERPRGGDCQLQMGNCDLVHQGNGITGMQALNLKVHADYAVQGAKAANALNEYNWSNGAGQCANATGYPGNLLCKAGRGDISHYQNSLGCGVGTIAGATGESIGDGT